MKKVRQVIPQALDEQEVIRGAKAQKVMRNWEEIVGVGLAARSFPDRYRHGTVWVAVESSAWAQELRMRKDLILARLAERSGDPTLFVDVRFGVRPLPKPTQATEPSKHDRNAYEGLSIREIAERRLANWEKDD